jgi:hypothetical protein
MPMTKEERKHYASLQVTVYAPNAESLDAWKKKAASVGLPLSKFVVECIESAMDEKPATSNDSDLIILLQRQLEETKQELRLNFANIRLQDKPELDPNEMKDLTRDVLKAIKRGGVWKPTRLMVELNLGIGKATLLSRAMRDLEDLGLVEETSTGWRYSG